MLTAYQATRIAEKCGAIRASESDVTRFFRWLFWGSETMHKNLRSKLMEWCWDEGYSAGMYAIRGMQPTFHGTHCQRLSSGMRAHKRAMRGEWWRGFEAGLNDARSHNPAG